MKVPKTIQVGGHTYTIVLSAHKMSDHEGSDGDVNHITHKIRVWSVLPPSRRMETLMHELFHAAHKIYARKEAATEVLFDALCEGLTQMLPQLGLELDWSDIPEED